MLAAVAAFSVMDATMKQLSFSYPPLEVSCLRGLTSIPFFLLVVTFAGSWRTLIPVRWGEHLVRGALAIAMLWTFVYALGELPLGTTYGIFLCAPLLITALSALILRDQVGLHRWLAVGCGMVGVIIILRPGEEGLITLAGLAAFASALCYAFSAVMIRRMSRTESTLSIGMSFMVMVSVGTGIAAYSHWLPVQGEHVPWLLLLGLTGALGQYLIIFAFRCASPSVVAPFEYTALIWGIALDWLLWSTIPSARVVTGAGVVIASGLYVLYREHWATRAPA
jgi:drug/metabolite transporter (DMT)-like permease